MFSTAVNVVLYQQVKNSFNPPSKCLGLIVDLRGTEGGYVKTGPVLWGQY